MNRKIFSRNRECEHFDYHNFLNENIEKFSDAEPYFLDWVRSGFKSPAPVQVKWNVLDRYASGNFWIETGTLWGETTNHLALRGNRVITIEAEKYIYELALEKFSGNNQITVLHGESEKSLRKVLEELLAAGIRELSLWLDGHFSGEGTHHGLLDTPITKELEILSEFIQKFTLISVFVDDIRLFNKANNTHKDYPDLNFLAHWASKHGLDWTIELDIFVATNNFNKFKV